MISVRAKHLQFIDASDDEEPNVSPADQPLCALAYRHLVWVKSIARTYSTDRSRQKRCPPTLARWTLGSRHDLRQGCPSRTWVEEKESLDEDHAAKRNKEIDPQDAGLLDIGLHAHSNLAVQSAIRSPEGEDVFSRFWAVELSARSRPRDGPSRLLCVAQPLRQG